MSQELDELLNQLKEKHTDNAFYVVTSEVNGMTDRSGRNDILSLKIAYAEDEKAEGNFKHIKFWMSKKDALGLGKFLVESAEWRGDNRPPVN